MYGDTISENGGNVEKKSRFIKLGYIGEINYINKLDSRNVNTVFHVIRLYSLCPCFFIRCCVHATF